MIGDSTERKMMRKKAFDNKYLGPYFRNTII